MYGSYSLSDSTLLSVTGNGRVWRSPNPEWCGKARTASSAAASLTAYLVHTRPYMSELYPSKSQQKNRIIELMDEYWKEMSPGRRGVLSVFPLRRALDLRGREVGLELPLRDLDIPMLKLARPSLDQCVGFIRAGLEADCPVAWLNLHSGRVRRLHHPQWLVITAMTLDGLSPITCTYMDNGREKSMDFRLWFQSTWLGGGLLYVARE